MVTVQAGTVSTPVRVLASVTVGAVTLAGWTMLVNQLMNLDEVLNK